MKKIDFKQGFIFTIFTLLIGNYFSVKAQPNSIPFLRKEGTATQLIVHCQPFLIRGGELGNSSSSSAEYMRPHWEKLARMNLNTVLVPFYWELMEPEECRWLNGDQTHQGRHIRLETNKFAIQRVKLYRYR